MEREILSKLLELINAGETVTFSEDLGGNSLTITCSFDHWHCGWMDGSLDSMLYELLRTLTFWNKQKEEDKKCLTD